jgi:cyclopropane fatty-acyl-phospholipid synthase-like methyltransferase
MTAQPWIKAALTLASVAMVFAQDHQHKAAAAPDHMEHHFDAAESAKNFDDPSRDAWQLPDKVIAALKLKPGQSIADIGAGTGYFSMRLAKSNPVVHVYAADIEPSMVDYLKARATKEGLANVTAVQAGPDAANLPSPVDVILIVDTYHHIGNRVTYFRKLANSLKPGGRLAIVDFKPEATMGPPKEFRFKANQIRAELKAAGFRQLEHHDFLPQQQFLIFSR